MTFATHMVCQCRECKGPNPLEVEVDRLKAEVARLTERESDLMHAAWNEGRKAQRSHSTGDFERIRARADAAIRERGGR